MRRRGRMVRAPSVNAPQPVATTPVARRRPAALRVAIAAVVIIGASILRPWGDSAPPRSSPAAGGASPLARGRCGGGGDRVARAFARVGPDRVLIDRLAARVARSPRDLDGPQLDPRQRGSRRGTARPVDPAGHDGEPRGARDRRLLAGDLRRRRARPARWTRPPRSSLAHQGGPRDAGVAVGAPRRAAAGCRHAVQPDRLAAPAGHRGGRLAGRRVRRRGGASRAPRTARRPCPARKRAPTPTRGHPPGGSWGWSSADPGNAGAAGGTQRRGGSSQMSYAARAMMIAPSAEIQNP